MYTVQEMVLLALGIAAVALAGWALLDAATSRADAFPATSNQTKTVWVAGMVVCLAIAFVTVRSPLNMFTLIAVVGAGVYLTRVRPAIRAITGKGGSSGGPYGGW